VVFYEMLTGELPLGRFAPPSAKTPVDRGVDELVFRTLEKDRERRFQSAGAVKTELDHLAAHPSSPTSSAASGGALPPDQDFILCPPALPRMAKAFLIYAFTIAPLFWLVSFLTITISPDVPQHPTAAWAHVGFNVLTSAGELAVLGLMLTAAWKLRSLRTGAVRWVKNVLRLHLACLVLALAGAIAVEEVRAAFEHSQPLERVQIAEAIFGATGVGAMLFELGVLLWLRRHGAAIESMLRPAPRPSDPRFPDAGKAGPPIIPSKTSSKAIVSALLAGGAFGPAVLMTLAARAGAGLGPLELLILGLVTLGCALAGTVLGWVALHEIRDSQGRLRGLPLAIGGALLWPLLTVALVVLGVPYLLVAEVNADGSLPGAGKMLPARLLVVILPAGTLAFALWAIHATTRWAGRFAPPSPKRGLLKWVFLAAVALGIGLILLQQARSGGRRTSQEPSAAVRKAPAPDAWVQITIRDVRIRTGKPGSPDTDRWLVLAYESEEHGGCDIAFSSHGGIANSGTLIQGSTREVPSTEPGGPPRVEHQLEYRLPDSMSAESVQAYRDEVSHAWVNKPLVIQPGSAFNLIDLDLGAAGRVRIEATGRARTPRP
jgi:hypothetical protein